MLEFDDSNLEFTGFESPDPFTLEDGYDTGCEKGCSKKTSLLDFSGPFPQGLHVEESSKPRQLPM